MKAFMLTVSYFNYFCLHLLRRLLCFFYNVPYTGLSTIRSPMDSTTTGKEQQKVISDQATTADSDSTPSLKRSWEEASLSSLQSKRIRANRNNDSKIAKEDLATSSKQSKDSSSFQVDSTKNHLMLSSGFLLQQVIRKLGGDVTMDGNMSTHIVTSKVRKTLNFCTALCSGFSL